MYRIWFDFYDMVALKEWAHLFDTNWNEGLQGSRKIGEQTDGQSNCLSQCHFVLDPWVEHIFGSIVVVAMMDPLQLNPIKGEPTMLSPLMITALSFHCIEHSVRVGRDQDLLRIQKIARMAPSSYTPNGLTELSDFIWGKCTSVVGTKRWEHRNDLLDFVK